MKKKSRKRNIFFFLFYIKVYTHTHTHTHTHTGEITVEAFTNYGRGSDSCREGREVARGPAMNFTARGET